MSNKQNKNNVELSADDIIAKLDVERATCIESLNNVLKIIDKWKGLLIIDDIVGTKHRICIRSANVQRGGGGKRTKYRYNGMTFESGQSLCDHLKLTVNGDSAVRVLNRHMASTPNHGIELLKTETVEKSETIVSEK